MKKRFVFLVWLLCCALMLALAGCDGGGSSTTLAVQTTVEPTTTTEAPPSFEDLINPDLTAADLKDTPVLSGDYEEVIEWARENLENTQEWKDFMMQHLGSTPLWKGDNNREGDYNACLLAWGAQGALENRINLSFNSFGTNGGDVLLDDDGFARDEMTGRIIGESASHVALILDAKPIILLSRESNPLVDGFIASGKDTTGVPHFVRIASDTILNCTDVDETIVGFDYAVGPEYPGGPSKVYQERESRYVKAQDKATLAMFFEPGSVLYTIEVGVGKQFDTAKWKVDEFGQPVAYVAIITRNHRGAQEIEQAILN